MPGALATEADLQVDAEILAAAVVLGALIDAAAVGFVFVFAAIVSAVADSLQWDAMVLAAVKLSCQVARMMSNGYVCK